MDNKEKTKFEHFCDFLIRVSYVAVFCLLIFLILGTFLDLDIIPRTSGLYSHSFIITCLVLIFVFVLSKKYESISVFKILELKRSLKESKDININLEKKNSELLERIVSICNNNFQSQKLGFQIFNGDNSNSAKPNIEVIQVSNEEAKEQVEIENKENETNKNYRQAENETQRNERIAQRKLLEKMEKVVLDAILKDKISPMQQVRFSKVSDSIAADPISDDMKIIFDGYYKTTGSEVFVEIVPNAIPSIIRFYNLYYRLSKIYLYGKTKNTPAYLRLILLNIAVDDREKDRVYIHKKQLEQYFKPAIENGLLTIEISGEENSVMQQKLDFENKE